jgi:hypothetical protein
MRWRRAIATVSTASSVFVVANVSVFAQSDSQIVGESSASTVIARHAPASVLRAYGSEEPSAASSVELPRNLTFAEHFRPILQAMLERSATFRRQCVRIAQSPELMVRMKLMQNKTTGGNRARTEIGISADRRVIASIAIRPLENLAELIAHEFEHVLEQLDGVDLRARSELSGTGVWNCEDGSFETVRAVRVGRVVARETSGER